jgi:DNA polymerase
LVALRREAEHCRRCPLWRNATQTVFGEGPVGATMMLVGEQPGDREDVVGRPFVGPAGLVLDKALAAAAIERSDVYLTNAVKHFKNELRGKRRLHKKPSTDEIEACRWWLDRELRLVHPRLIVALGATAASALLQKRITIEKVRARPLEAGGNTVWVTVHPSYLLRIPDEEDRHSAFHRFVSDLKDARRWLSHNRR